MSNKFVVNGGLSIPTGKTLEIGTLSLSGIYQGDSLSNDEANKKIIPSEYSVKTYVDAQLTSSDLDFKVDNTSYDLDLTTERLDFAGTTNEVNLASVEADGVVTLTVGLPGAVTITTSAAIGGLTVAAGSITDITGEISFGDEDLSTSGTLAAGATTVTGAISASSSVTAGSIVVGDADMSESDLEKLDGITNGTALASKAVVLDASKDISGINEIGSGAITSTGAVEGTSLTDGTMTITSGNMSSVGTIGSGAVTSTGASSFATLSVSTSANLADGSTTNSNAAPTEDKGIANKKYVDDQLGSSALTLVTDVNGEHDASIDLDSETLSILGTANEIESALSADETIKIGLPSAVEITTSMKAGTLSVAAGSITDTSGDISFGDDNIDTSGTLDAGATTVTGAISASSSVTAGSIVVGDADMSEADLEKLDGITNGTAAANKAVVLDASKDISGVNEIGSGAITSTGDSSFGTIGSGAITSTGAVEGTSLTDGTMTVSSGNMSAVGTIASGAVTSTGSSSFVTLAVSTSADLADGSTMNSDAAPTVDKGIANKKYVDDQVTGADLDVKVGETSYDLDLTTEKLAFAGTSNEIVVAFTESNAGNTGNEGTLTVSLPDDVTIGDTLAVTGASSMNGAVTLGNATSDDITFTGRAASGLAPKADDTHDLGTSALHWNVAYANEVRSDANEMIISADGDETSVSGEAADSLSLNASGGIFTDDAVDMDSTLNVESTVTMQADATVGTTLAVTGVGTFTAQSVHTGGIESGGDIVSDTDSTDDLGSSEKRWASVHSDQVEMEHSARKDFSVAPSGAALTVLTFADATYQTAKVVCKIKSGDNVTAQELLIVSHNSTCTVVEYAKVSVGTEVDMTWAATSNGTTTTVTCDATGALKGSYDLVA